MEIYFSQCEVGGGGGGDPCWGEKATQRGMRSHSTDDLLTEKSFLNLVKSYKIKIIVTPLFDLVGAKQNSVWYQFIWKSVITVQIRVRFNKIQIFIWQRASTAVYLRFTRSIDPSILHSNSITEKYRFDRENASITFADYWKTVSLLAWKHGLS